MILPTSTSRRCLNAYDASGFATVRLRRRRRHHRRRRCCYRCPRCRCCFARRCCCFLLCFPPWGLGGIGGDFLLPPCRRGKGSRSLRRSWLLPRRRRRLRCSPVPLGTGTGDLPLPQLWVRPPQRRPRSQTPLHHSAEEPAPRRLLLGPIRGSALGSLR